MPQHSTTSAARWMELATASYWLWAESSMVIALRVPRLMTGDAAAMTEANRMITEKWQAATELGTSLAFAAPTSPERTALKAVKHYGARVSANRKRLGG